MLQRGPLGKHCKLAASLCHKIIYFSAFSTHTHTHTHGRQKSTDGPLHTSPPPLLPPVGEGLGGRGRKKNWSLALVPVPQTMVLLIEIAQSPVGVPYKVPLQIVAGRGGCVIIAGLDEAIGTTSEIWRDLRQGECLPPSLCLSGPRSRRFAQDFSGPTHQCGKERVRCDQKILRSGWLRTVGVKRSFLFMS